MKMTRYSDNLWAEEMGINLDDLLTESPLHIKQIRNARIINKRAAEYWARERFLARLEYRAGAIFADIAEDDISDTRDEGVKKSGRRAKVKPYEFTEAQLEIARRSLDAGGSV